LHAKQALGRSEQIDRPQHEPEQHGRTSSAPIAYLPFMPSRSIDQGARRLRRRSSCFTAMTNNGTSVPYCFLQRCRATDINFFENHGSSRRHLLDRALHLVAQAAIRPSI
jgi:hypothetical protein